MKIENLQHTCHACPSQWEFVTDGERPVYVRYRWGWLSVRVGRKPGDNAVTGVPIIGEQLGDSLDGVLEWDVVEGKIRDLDVEKELRRPG